MRQENQTSKPRPPGEIFDFTRTGLNAAEKEIVSGAEGPPDETEEFKSVLIALRDQYFSLPPGLDRLESMPIPKLPAIPVHAAEPAKIQVAGSTRKSRSVVLAPVRSSRFSQWKGAWGAALVAATVLAVIMGWAMVTSDAKQSEARRLAAAADPLTPEVRSLFLAGTDLELEAGTHATMNHGSAWFWVTPGGKGFRVTTPYGEATVTGTIFGVSISGEKMKVDVIEGSVNVTEGNANARILRGQSVQAGPLGMEPVQMRPEGQDPPRWVTQAVVDREYDRQARMLLPSVAAKTTNTPRSKP